MNPLKNYIAISCACLTLLILGTVQAWAGEAIGSVTLVNGPLLVKREGGAIKALALHSLVERGDVLVSESGTYARISFTDDIEITLRPNTQLKVESYSFNGTGTDNGDTVFSVSKGAVQVKTGRADQHRIGDVKLFVPTLVNPSGIAVVKREAGTTFVLEYVPSRESRLALAETERSGLFQSDRMYASGFGKINIRPQWRALKVRPHDGSSIFAFGDLNKYASLLSTRTWFQAGHQAASLNIAPPLDLNGSSPNMFSKISQVFSQIVEPPSGFKVNKVGILLAQNSLPSSSGGGLAPGLYVHVIDGLIQLSNRGGVQQFAAGQFGFTGSVVQPPVIVPKNPGIQFTPPPMFSSSSGPSSTSSSGAKPKTVDCEVR